MMLVAVIAMLAGWLIALYWKVDKLSASHAAITHDIAKRLNSIRRELDEIQNAK